MLDGGFKSGIILKIWEIVKYAGVRMCMCVSVSIDRLCHILSIAIRSLRFKNITNNNQKI